MDRTPRRPKGQLEIQAQAGELLRGEILDAIIEVQEEIDEILPSSPPRTPLDEKIARLAPSLPPALVTSLEGLVAERARYDRAVVKLSSWMVPDPSLVKYSVVSKDDEPTVVVTRGELEGVVAEAQRVLAELRAARADGIKVE